MVGAHLTALLLSEGYSNVTVVARSPEKTYLLKKILKHKGVLNKWKELNVAVGELSDYRWVKELIQPGDVIFHCAAAVFLKGSITDLIENNLTIAHIVSQVAAENQAKMIVNISSIAALDENTDSIDETSIPTTLDGKSGYSLSKFYCENEINRISWSDTEVIHVNPSIILGIGNWRDSSSKLFRVAARGFKYYTEGVVGYVSVNDVAKAMLLLSHCEKAVGERFVLNAENLSFKELFDKMAREFGKEPPQIKISDTLIKTISLLLRGIDKLGIKTSLSGGWTESLIETKRYDGNKIRSFVEFEYEPIDSIVAQCVAAYKEDAKI